MGLPAVFHVSIKSKGDECGQISKAEMVYNIDIHIAHPRFRQLNDIMNSKIARGEVDDYRANAREYLTLADVLIENALEEIEGGIKKKLGRLGTAIGLLVFCSLILGYEYLTAGVCTLVACIPLAGYVWWLRAKLNTLNSWGCDLFADFDNRLDNQVMAAFPDLKGGVEYPEQTGL